MLEKKSPDIIISQNKRTYSNEKFLCTLRKIEEYDKNETCWHNKSFVEP